MDWADRIGRRIKLRDINILLAVAESGSMVKAGKLLSISQPVISKAVSDLERTLGVRLLERSRSGIEVTSCGRALLDSGRAAFDDLRRGVKEIEFLNDPTSGEVRVGATEPMVTGLLPNVVDRLRSKHSQMAIDVMQANSTSALHDELRERKVDFLVGRLPPNTAGTDLNLEVLYQDPSLVVAASHSKWSRRRDMSLSQLAHAKWVLPRAGTPARELISDWFRRHGVELSQAPVVTDSIQFQVALLASGQFISILPLTLVHFSARRLGLKIVIVREPPPYGPVGIVTLRNRIPSPATKLFLEAVRLEAEPLKASASKLTSSRPR